MIDKSTFGFVRYMLQYGIYLGCLVGFFGAIPLALMAFPGTGGYFLLIGVLFSVVMGVIIGATYGCMAGFASGVAMSAVTRLFFREVKQVRVYKAVMSVTVFATTGLTFLLFPLFMIVNDANMMPSDYYGITIPYEAWYALWLMALVFAVYGGQRVATAYLLELDRRKQKVT